MSTYQTLRECIAAHPDKTALVNADGTFSPIDPPVTSTVYPTLTPRQIRLALHGVGLLAAVEAAIATAGPEAQIVWEYAIEFERHHPLVATLAPAIGMTEEQLDALWMAAAEL